MNDQAVFPEWRNFLGGSGDKETAGFIKSVVKRSGDIASYDRKKIESAIDRAIEAVEKRKDPERAENLTDAVEERLRLRLAGSRTHSIPAIEEIQDDVESVLIENNEVEVAKAYILYRARHEAIRDAKNLMLDINGYRAARRVELTKIAQEAIKRVLATGETVSLEAMNPFERKVCHDVVAAAGLVSESEGAEPHRYVVVLPADEEGVDDDAEDTAEDSASEQA